jgi:hypothetical protein
MTLSSDCIGFSLIYRLMIVRENGYSGLLLTYRLVELSICLRVGVFSLMLTFFCH